MALNCAPGVPFTKDQLTQALSQLPANKAVAYCFAPTIILKEQASAIADLLFPNLCNWWQQFPPKMPQRWRDGWMVLLPKPGKKTDRCAHLRPLALAEPCGKAIAGLLTQVAQTQILHKLCTVPQFGYMPQRSTFDAIRRVTQHVAQVQQLIYAQRFKLRNHRDSIASLPCHGGLQVYLDLSKAFDSVDRDTLWSALRNIGVSHDVLTLLEFLHLGSQYHVTNGQLSAQLLVTKGVRQGCKAAPLLWTVLVYELFQQLQRTTGQQWLRDFVTAFADDFNIACPIHCSADLDKHLRCIGQLLDLLKSFGLKVNPEKRTVLLTLRGSASKAVLQQHTCWHHDKRHLNIPCADGDTQMPIDTTAQYLGVTISYTSTAALTMQHRLKQAVKCFGRLRCWLRSTSKVNMQARFQLWKRTVVPTLTYGLGATGLTTHGIVAMCTEIHRQLRVIAGDHAYRTHNTNQAVLQRFGWPSAPDLLEAALNTMQSTVHRRQNQLQRDDILRDTDWTILDESFAVLRQVKTQLMSTDDDAIPSALCQFPCKLCNKRFPSSLGLYMHLKHAHQIIQRYWSKFTPAKDAVNTVPTCTYCQKSFTNWRQLKAHVARHTENQTLTPQLSEAAQTQVLYEQLLASDRGSVVIQALRTHDWNRLTQPLRNWLSSHCVLCDTHMISMSAMTYHTKQHHASCADTVLRNAPILWREIGATTPCRLCGTSFVSEHTCPTAHQLALLMHLDPDQESMALQRPQTTGLSYIQSRDAVPGTTTCAHCKKDFAGFGGLRKHILKRACYAFDPNRAQTLLPIHTDAMTMLHNGTLPSRCT